MSIKVRRNGAWVDAAIKKYVNGEWSTPDKQYYVRTPNISGVPPFTFKSDGENLRDWSMSGQTVQASTPTPSSPVDVSGVGERTGNLFTEIFPTAPTTSNQYIAIYVGSGTFTLSTSTPKYNGQWCSLFFLAGNVDSGGSSSTNGVALNEPRTVTAIDGYVTIGYRKYSDIDMGWVMLNTGSTALPYEPYGYKIPITCGGTTTNIYLGSATSTRKIKKLVLTGEENYSDDGGNAPFSLLLSSGMPEFTATQILWACSHYQAVENAASWASYNSLITSTTRNTMKLRFRDTSCADLAAFKTYLAQQYANGTPVTIWYVLATPETAVVNEPLQKIGSYADEISKTGTGVDIPTVSGSNTLSVGTTVQPSEMTIESISQWV